MSPPRAVSAPSGDSCDARLTRAPQEISESPGSPFWVTFLAKQKGNWPRAATEHVGGDTIYVLISYVPQTAVMPAKAGIQTESRQAR
ncbi:MAG: hypothetical protein ABL985_14180 [Casimicrobium sp.]